MTVKDFLASMSYAAATEDRAAVDGWLKRHNHRFGHYIDGSFREPGEKQLDVRAPSTGEKLATITMAHKPDVEQAVAAARSALPHWRALGPHGRARYLYAFARAIQRQARLFAVLESLDNGKPIRETRDIDIPLAIRHFYHHAGWAQIIEEEFADHDPLGVIGQIIPWNFPFLMLAWKIAPALAAGNTVVLKPAEYTSLTALLFAEICQDIGLPPGVVNIITGDGDTGAALVASDVDKIAFTGSTEVGQSIRRTLAGSGGKLTLELGGKSPYIVFDDADSDSAVEGLVDAIWFNQGQVCCAGSRLLVQEGIADRFYEKIKRRMKSLRIGHSLDKSVDIGALIDQSQKDRILALLDQGKKEGARLWTAAGDAPDSLPDDLPENGVFMAPVLATGVETNNCLMQQEIFGPVLAATSFRTQDEAISLANNSIYGLAASIWSESLSRALEVAPALKAGVVWINGANMFDASVGFGGYRQSGFGREGGREGMLAYLKPDYETGLAERPFAPPPLSSAPEQSTTSVEMSAHTVASGSGFLVLKQGIDRTIKHYIGGKQVRPDSGRSLPVLNKAGIKIADVPEGNRKDIRHAVEAAIKAAASWRHTSAHNRAQILYYIAENLDTRQIDFIKRLQETTGIDQDKAEQEVAVSLERLFAAAAYADKVDGLIHQPPLRGVALAMNEPVGVIAIVLPDECPLLSFITLMAHAVAAGNSCIILPSERYPLAVTDFYPILETSDVPDGVINTITGCHSDLAATLAQHHGVNALWHFGSKREAARLEKLATETMKRCWFSYDRIYDWYDPKQMASRPLMERAYEVKNIWIPYGDANTSANSY